ncbi:MAG: hypothetical protein JO127_12925 [Caulobacteraceae bacterium]|nr:hypothetical protein [Caulobacteraceae bacterium]
MRTSEGSGGRGAEGKRSLGPAVIFSLLIATPIGASAAPTDEVDPKASLAALRVWNSQLLKDEPSLMAVEAAVTGDCREKAPHSVNSVDYCSCARAVVMKLWMSGVDPAMVRRLKDYAANPASMAPSEFLRYQGPELYQPFCESAVGAG